MAYRVADEPDTLPYASQVQAWMAADWRHGTCPVCGADDWVAEGRLFGVPRLPPSPSSGLVRAVFPVLCVTCSYTIWITATTAGLLESPIPDDLSELAGDGAGEEGVDHDGEEAG